MQEGRLEALVLHGRHLVPEGGEVGPALAEGVDPEDRLVLPGAAGGRVAPRGGEDVGGGQNRHLVVELVGRHEALAEARRHRVLAVHDAHFERVAGAVELLRRRFGPPPAHHLRVLLPRRLGDPGPDVAVGEDVVDGEGVGRAVDGDEPLAAAHEVDEGLLRRGAPPRPAVVGDDEVVDGQRLGGQPGRLLDHPHVEAARVDQELPQEGRRRAPVVVVPAGEKEHPQLVFLEEAGPHVRGLSRRGGEEREGEEDEAEAAQHGSTSVRSEPTPRRRRASTKRASAEGERSYSDTAAAPQSWGCWSDRSSRSRSTTRRSPSRLIGEAVHVAGGPAGDERPVRPVLGLVARALEAPVPLLPAQRRVLVRAGEVERVGVLLEAHEDHLRLAVDGDAVGRRQRDRRSPPAPLARRLPR